MIGLATAPILPTTAGGKDPMRWRPTSTRARHGLRGTDALKRAQMASTGTWWATFRGAPTTAFSRDLTVVLASHLEYRRAFKLS